MSAETVPEDETEIQDLVLLFANSRIPRGSDAFQTLIDDFLKHEVEPEVRIEVTSDSSDSSELKTSSGDESANERKPSPNPPKSALRTSSTPKPTKTVRMVSPKPLAHVHWPDEANANLASSPASGQRRHARMYVKTTPKPILKHDDSLENQT